MPDKLTTPMICASEAESLIRAWMPAFAVETRSIDNAAGTILRQRIVAERDQPPYDRISMDGIAIRFEDFVRGTRYFDVLGMQPAGAAPLTLERADACIEVMTGAVRPDGCDTVIAVEQTSRGGRQIAIDAEHRPQCGQFIHRRGSDCHAGDILIDAGALLRAPEIAVIAANGHARVEVAAQPRITILATGDELVEVDAPVAPWQIRRSNDRALAAMLENRGLRDVLLEHVQDQRQSLQDAIARHLRARDVLILSGGVSMGQRDYVPEVLHALGVERVFHKIAQRPGKPMWFGIGPQGQPVFALPGNPVSVLVCAARYVLPALLHAMGQAVLPPTLVALASAVDFGAALTYFVPAKLRHDSAGAWSALPLPPQTSGDFSALTQTDGFVELPPGRARFPAGFIAAYYPW